MDISDTMDTILGKDEVEPSRNRRLPSLDNILNASPSETTEQTWAAATTNPGVFSSSQVSAPSSSPIGPGFASSKCQFNLDIFQTNRKKSPSPSEPPPYIDTPAPSSAGDKFRTWFPGVIVERVRGSSPRDPSAYRTKFMTTAVDQHRPLSPLNICVSEAEQPRRVSPPSISSIAGLVGEGLGKQHDQHRRSSASEKSSSNRPVTPVVWGHSTPAGTRATDASRLPPSITPMPATVGSGLTSGGSGHPSSRHHHPQQRVKMALPDFRGLFQTSPDQAASVNAALRASLLDFGRSDGSPAASTERSETKTGARTAKTRKRGSSGRSGDDSDGQEPKRFKCSFKECNKSYTWKENLTRHKSTDHAPMQNRCPFCKVNGLRPSFNRLDNYKEHIRRHTRRDGGGGGDGDGGRASGRSRTEYHPQAQAYYRGITRRAKRRRQEQAAALKRGRVAAPEGVVKLGSPWSETSDGVDEKMSDVVSVISLAV